MLQFITNALYCMKFSIKKIFARDADGDFKDDRIVLVVFGIGFLLTGFVEAI
jgi:hypothetical protein